MKEAFLQYIWKNGLFDHNNMRAETGESIEVISLGHFNSDAGPDFLDAKIKIGDIVWVGNVEIHVKASDWFRHNHQKDRAYDNVILHVVDEPDMIVNNSFGNCLISYKIQYSPSVYKEYEYLVKDRGAVNCFSHVNIKDSFRIHFWLQRLLVERVDRKANEVFNLYINNEHSWEETFYQLLSRYLGLSVNVEPFELLARSVPLKVLLKQRSSLLQIEALLFGQAGFLDEVNSDKYKSSLRKEYDYLRKKYNLEPLNPSMWKFMRTRPYNFPTMRIAQLANILFRCESLFSYIVEAENVGQIKKLFRLSASSYWDTHFTFGNKTDFKSSQIGDAALDIVIINAVVPTIFAYGRYINNEKLMAKAIDFLDAIKLEKNYITNMWVDMGLYAKSAADSQAIIQLKKEYCDRKRCLHCELGYKLMKENQ